MVVTAGHIRKHILPSLSAEYADLAKISYNDLPLDRKQYKSHVVTALKNFAVRLEQLVSCTLVAGLQSAGCFAFSFINAIGPGMPVNAGKARR